MPSELDRSYDAMLAHVTGPGGQVVVDRDEAGRAIVENFPATVPGMLAAFCALHADKEALVSGAERFTFPDLDRWSDEAARGLVARGVRPGERVAIAMRNCPAWIITYLAALKAGAIATLINGWWQADELAHALALTEPQLIIADAARAARIAETGAANEVLVLEIDRPLAEAIAPLLGAEAALPEIGADDDATILFTSGSTGGSKGALSTHRAVTTGAYTYATGLITMLGLLTSEGRAPATPPRTLAAVPLFHVTGEVPVMLASIVIGRCLVLMSKWDAGEALRLIERERISYFVGVPTMGHELMTHEDRRNYDLSSLTDIAAGGAPRPVDHVRRLGEEFPGAQPALGYGLTETNAVGCSNFWGNYADKPASTGRPQRPFVEIAILGADDAHLASGERGEVGIRSAANIKLYWNAPEATAAAFTDDGFMRTGDIGYLDADGYLFIVDRKKDIIIRGGENISSQEVEAACYACPAVAEVAVFGVADDRLGEVPLAIIHRHPGALLDADELTAFLERKIAAFKVPRSIVFSPEPLPRLGTGKIDRVALKALHQR